MKALSLHGPWAYYERKAAENECRITDLEGQLRSLALDRDNLQHKLIQAESDMKRFQDVEKDLRADKDRAQGVIDSLQAELAQLRLRHTDDTTRLTSEVTSLTQELQKLSADNAVLRSELAKTVHAKQLTSTKLDQIRKKLGLTESEAKAFIQELDDARAASKSLREENKELASDNTHLKQQVESRSQHCMTLIGENKRLLEQVAELRVQLQRQQGELWQAKTEHSSAAAAVRQLQAVKGPQVVVREWAQEDGKPAGKAGSGAGRGAGGSQNRPPWSDKPTGKDAKAAGGAGKAAGAAGGAGPGKRVQVVPVGSVPLVGTDTARAGVLRQALAVRQERLASASAAVERAAAS
ncbi:hypothetical protein HYH03_009000 [Edaphochlamys debaryana]|uniref:Uncharacterized protein n=1 Tax=Edaphochlamys debaryana TaxID=47281 RepID=A0A835Y2E4_9CHLO|nr:hypothetical protein HYH03_009000 [Edaphochlamys debaryana]|eukprot:KAG2492846.1 hypothetical protein HYH03_009000 [Edaphochlamys debaryana]